MEKAGEVGGRRVMAGEGAGWLEKTREGGEGGERRG